MPDSFLTLCLAGGTLTSVSPTGQVQIQPAADDQQLADALLSLIGQGKNQPVLAAIGGDEVHSRVLTLDGSLSGTELTAAVASGMALDQRLNKIVETSVATADGEDGKSVRRVLGAGISRSTLQKFASLVGASGGVIAGVEPAVVSLARSSVLMAEGAQPVIGASIETDGTVQLAITDAAGIKTTRTLKGSLPVNPDQLADEIKATVARAEISIPAGLFISGAVEETQLSALITRLNELLDFPCRLNEAGGLGQEAAVCAGLLAGWTIETSVAPLDLQGNKRKRQVQFSRETMITAAVATFAVVAAIGWFTQGQAEKSSAEQLAAAQAKYTAISGPAGIGPGGGVGTLASSRENYEALLAAIALTVNRDAKLTSVSIGAIGSSGAGGTVRIEGCSSGQENIASLLDRAAKVPSITDAQLESSGATAGGCTGGQVGFALILTKQTKPAA